MDDILEIHAQFRRQIDESYAQNEKLEPFEKKMADAEVAACEYGFLEFLKHRALLAELRDCGDIALQEYHDHCLVQSKHQPLFAEMWKKFAEDVIG